MRLTREEYEAILRRPAIEKNNPALVSPNPVRDSHWTDREIEILKAAYSDPSAPVNIGLLAANFGRTYASVALKASRLGLGNYSRKERPESILKMSQERQTRFERMSADEKRQRTQHLLNYVGTSFLGHSHTDEVKNAASKRMREYWKTHQHPKGMLGKHHINEAKAKWSRMKRGQKVPRERTIRQMKTHLLRYGSVTYQGGKRSWKSQWVTVGGQRFFARSLWEANYARYLEFLKSHGEILSWEHEPETFWFDGLKRGCVSYLPDFRVKLWTGEIEYHEVKGWMDARSKTKIKRMAKYHPEVKLVVIDSPRYKAISSKAIRLIPDWNSTTQTQG